MAKRQLADWGGRELGVVRKELSRPTAMFCIQFCCCFQAVQLPEPERRGWDGHRVASQGPAHSSAVLAEHQPSGNTNVVLQGREVTRGDDPAEAKAGGSSCSHRKTLTESGRPPPGTGASVGQDHQLPWHQSRRV